MVNLKLVSLVLVSFVRNLEACKCTCDCCDDVAVAPTDDNILFYDDFNTFNLDTWQHEITAGGGGNNEFQYYTNNRSNSYVRDGKLFIKPTLTEDKYDENFVKYGTLNLEGTSPANMCTGRQWGGCEKSGDYNNPQGEVVNPVQSARIRSVNSFSFLHGKLEIEAQLPKGDWLWPAIWLLPKTNLYGDWPASGEIDIMESTGNVGMLDASGKDIGPASVGYTLHWGPFWPHNAWYLTHQTRALSDGETYADGFHVYTLEKTADSLKCFVDGELLLDATPPNGQSYYEFGDFASIGDIDNPWSMGSKMAPFDQEYFLILNVAVGGTGGFFPDDVQAPRPKPWNNTSPHAKRDFWEKKNEWFPTWKGEEAAMKINYVKVTKL